MIPFFRNVSINRAKKLGSRLFTFMLILALGLPLAAQAAETVGLAHPWQLGFNEGVTPVKERLNHLHDILLVIITIITLFVLALLVYICLRFNRRANPTPSSTSHNTVLEIVWTAIPVMILIGIGALSLPAHYFVNEVQDAEMTVKVVGRQWFWSYEYPDHGNIAFDSYMKKDEELQPGEPRLLTVDNQLVVPVDTNIRVLITGGDVIHNWAVPSFGVKRDAVPGRLNESWFRAEKTGVFYGQCSELCGVGHGFMPIVVHVVSKEDFQAWVASKTKQAARPENGNAMAKQGSQSVKIN